MEPEIRVSLGHWYDGATVFGTLDVSGDPPYGIGVVPVECQLDPVADLAEPETVPFAKVDLSQMEEIKCPDCGSPLFALPVDGGSQRHTFQGCRCGREHFELPDCVVAGFEGAPKFFYVPKQ